MQSFSQLGQDLAVLKYYNNKRNGYFVEAGASDGLDLSNTYLLEKEFGWSGICVEPIPEIFKRLVVNRPNSKCFQIPLFSEAEKDVVFSIAGYTACRDSIIASAFQTFFIRFKTIGFHSPDATIELLFA